MKGHILLVDDDARWLETIARAHKRAGYQVTEARSGEEALSLLAQSGTTPPHYNIVLTDISMHEVNGIDVTNAARQLPEPPEVILLTGVGSLETAIGAVQAGAFDYMLKPCGLKELLERVEQALQRHRENVLRARQAGMVSQICDIVSSAEAPVTPASTGYTPPATTGRYIVVGNITIDTHTHEVTYAQEKVHVTRTEYLILTCLARNPNRVVAYSDVIQAIRGYTLKPTEAQELLRQHIRNLRNKFAPAYFVNSYGFGYMMTAPGMGKNDGTTSEAA